MPRLGIVGTFVWDTVWTLADQAAGRPLETWGGMSFSLAAAAAARPAGWEVVPIAHVGADMVGAVHDFLETLGGIGPRGGIVPVDQPNNRVELVYTDDARRGETLIGGVPGWGWDELEPRLEGLDALCVNFLSGWELDLPAAARLRGLSIPVYADLHSLFLGPPRADGPRLPRRLPRWEDWLRCFGAVQMNEDEYELLCGRRLEPGQRPDWVLGYGARAAFVTQGGAGVSYAADQAFPAGGGVQGAVELGHVPALPCEAGGDPTGCGDAWGASAFCGLLGGLGVRRAVQRANALAAVKMRHRGGSGLFEHLCAHRGEWDGGGPEG